MDDGWDSYAQGQEFYYTCAAKKKVSRDAGTSLLLEKNAEYRYIGVVGMYIYTQCNIINKDGDENDEEKE